MATNNPADAIVRAPLSSAAIGRALVTLKPLPVHVIGLAIVALAAFGVWVTTHAIWVVAHGGNTAFEGAFAYPSWSVVHFVAAQMFVVILPFQLSARIRNAHRRAHRIAGRVAAACGVAFGVTGLLLPFVMPARPFGERAFMATAATAIVFFLFRGVAAARRRDVATHRRWMLRVTAGALAPLTERIIFPLLAASGIHSMAGFWDVFATALWFSFAVNLAIVERWIQWTALQPGDATTSR